MKEVSIFCLLSVSLLISCGQYRTQEEQTPETAKQSIELQDIAKMFSVLDLKTEHLEEVHDAVIASARNGYDEEYTMKDIFDNPGTGVGDAKIATKAATVHEYDSPLRDLITAYLCNQTKADLVGMTPEEYLEILKSGDFQVYWPFAENWDGQSMPTITFAPTGTQSSNTGYRLDGDGNVVEVLVDEKMAETVPVWVINRNDDASFETLEVLKQNHPEWEEGGTVIVNTKSGLSGQMSGETHSLVMKDLTALRNFDTFFAGGSEIFIKIGAIEAFTASTEAEMLLYNPVITDFMIKVKRKEVGQKKEINTLLVSEWTSQLDNIAFMVTEDDGGTQTSWKCTALVRVQSKSYGLELELPFHSRDDIIWRGQMSRKYIESNSDIAGYFGDVLITFVVK